MNTPATPTPATDGERVLAWFPSVGLMCVDLNGQRLWSNTELVSEPRFGPASSPVLHDGIAVLVSDLPDDDGTSQSAESWIAAVEASNGEVLWRKARKGHSRFGAYSTPVVHPSGGGDIVWVHGWHGVDGYDLRTGELRHQHAYELRANHLVASPAVVGNRLVFVGPQKAVCLDLTALSEGSDPVPVLWSVRMRGEISASPVAAGDLVFLVNESGLAMCLDLANGEKYWESRLPKRYFASVIAAGGRVYLCSENGRTTVVERAPEMRVLAENDLGEDVYASIAVSGERLLIRSTEHLYCIVEPPVAGGDAAGL
jgi:outer membrane protein assembly factor BamB